jgi:MSHA biogenesis protein MshG
MSVYRYSGRNRRGELVNGQVEAPHPQAVATTLSQSGIVPVTITKNQAAVGQPSWLQSLQGNRAPSALDLLLFTRQMATMMRAGVPILQALVAIQKSSNKPRMVEVLQALRDELDKGQALSGAMAKHPALFDDYYLSMVRVGEDSGQLDEIFLRLTTQLSFDRQMQQKIKAAMRYPSFVLIAIVVAIAILSIFVIPVFAGVYSNMKVELPPLTRLLLATSAFAVNYWWSVALGAIAAGYAVRRLLQRPAYRYEWDRAKLKLPVIGGIFSKAAIARFSVAYTIASRSGVPLTELFTLVARVVDNAYYSSRILGMRDGVSRGDNMARVTQVAGIFPPLVLQMVAVGEETGEIDGMLEQVAKMYQEELDYEVSRLSESIEPILLAVMGALVAILMVGIFLPLWDLGTAAR